MTEEITINYCKQYIKDFLEDLKNGKIKDFYSQKNQENSEILKNYFFENLYNNEKYGYGENITSSNDSDSAKLAKIIHFIYFNKIIDKIHFTNNIKPKLKMDKAFKIYLDDILLNSADTLNTFNTLFWSKCAHSIDNYITNNENFSPKIYDSMVVLKYNEDLEFEKPFLLDFHKEFQRIGNFMLLPSSIHSINQYRGTCQWCDFFEIFLKEIKNFYDNKKDVSKIKNSGFREKLEQDKENNLKYFNLFENFDDFVNFNCLGAYFNDKSFQNFKELQKDGLIYHWYKTPNILKEKYENFAKHYVKCSKNIINQRSFDIINTIL